MRDNKENYYENKAIVLFFCDGWIGGRITQFEIFAQHYAAEGMIAILVDYRVKSRQGTTSALRNIPENLHPALPAWFSDSFTLTEAITF